MTNFETAVNAIRNIDSNDELAELFNAIKLQRTWISNQTRRSLMLGDVVEFDRGPRRGGVAKGEVVKINTKNVKVKVGMSTWNVPAAMLTKVEDTADLS